MEAYDLSQRGVAAIEKVTREQNLEARRLCTQSTILDQNYSAAYWCLAGTYMNAWMWGWEVDPQTVDPAFELLSGLWRWTIPPRWPMLFSGYI